MNLTTYLQRERQRILKLFLALQATGLVSGMAIASAVRVDPFLGMAWGLSLSSANFGVSLCLSSKQSPP